MRRALALLALCLTAAPLLAQPRGGVLRGTIVNGTTGEPGAAERITLLELGSGMQPVASREGAQGSFVLEGFELRGEKPYLLQVTAQGVNYSQMVQFGRGYEAEATVTVYDATDDPGTVELTTARYLVRRNHDRLRIDKLFVFENRSAPKKTYHDPDGTFRFELAEELLELHSVSASSEGGIPVPQSAIPAPGGEGYVTTTAFKPGATDIAISYEVDYSGEAYSLAEKSHYAIPELLVLVSPPDIEVDAEGWEDLGSDPQNRFVVYRQRAVAPGAAIALDFAGGSEEAPEFVPSSSSSSQGSDAGRSIAILPDPLRPRIWILVLLMGASLAYGLLNALVPAPDSGSHPDPKRESIRRELGRLASRHAAGDLSSKSYRRKKRKLESELEHTPGRGTR